MVPSTVTTLEEFPLTPNGKIDRKALPEPVRERSDAHELVAPRTALESKLAAIWERELDIQPIGVTDDFFDLGVTSIVAATLFAAIEHELGDSLPLGAIFRAPTIEKLAALIEGERGHLALDLARSDPAARLAPADLLRARRRRHDPAPAAARAPARLRAAVLRPAVERALRRQLPASRRSRRWPRTTSPRCARCTRAGRG